MTLPRRELLAILPLAMAVPARAQQRIAIPPQWYAVQTDQNAFTVEMPGVPDHRILDDRSARGTPFQVHSYSLEAGATSYVAQTALLPPDVDTTRPRVFLQAGLNDRAQRLATRKWTTVAWQEIDGAAAVASIGPVGDGKALRLLTLLKESRFVQLAFLGAAASVNGAEAGRFFKSMKMR